MRYTKIVLLLNAYISFQLHSAMEQETVPLRCTQLEWQLVERCLNHEAICMLAATSTAHNAYFLSTAEQRKKLVSLKTSGMCLGKLTHKYGSARYGVFENAKSNQLILVSCVLDDDGELREYFRCFDHFLHELPRKPTPFFNEQGEFSFYGYGKKVLNHLNTLSAPEIIVYGLQGSQVRCMMNKPLENYLIAYLEYPNLLKAILNPGLENAKMVMYARGDSFESHRVYSLEGVIIPDDYEKQEIFPLLYKDYAVASYAHNNGDAIAYIKKVIEQRRSGQSGTWFLNSKEFLKRVLPPNFK